jgi:ATP-dependent DNA ligase
MPRIAEAVRGLTADEALIDGEAVVLRPDGRSDFEALTSAAAGRPPTSPSISCALTEPTSGRTAS